MQCSAAATTGEHSTRPALHCTMSDFSQTSTQLVTPRRFRAMADQSPVAVGLTLFLLTRSTRRHHNESENMAHSSLSLAHLPIQCGQCEPLCSFTTYSNLPYAIRKKGNLCASFFTHQMVIECTPCTSTRFAYDICLLRHCKACFCSDTSQHT